MAFRGGGSGIGRSKNGIAPPKNYVPGIGRGASGFTTRSDVGPAAPASAAGAAAIGAGGGSGSRSAEARAAAILQKQQSQQNDRSKNTADDSGGGLFGSAPANYVPGAGRGAGRLGADDGGDGPMGTYDPFGGYSGNNNTDGGVDGQYDDDDDEADRVWAAIDERMNNRRRKRRKPSGDDNDGEEDGAAQSEADGSSARARIGAQFRELKERLSSVSEQEWASIPDVGDHSLKYKNHNKQRQDVFTPITDQLLDQRHRLNFDATAGGDAFMPAGTLAVSDSGNKSSATINADGTVTSTAGTLSVANMSGLSAARGTVLGMSLDKMSDSVGGQTNVDPQGYLTSLASTQRGAGVAGEVGDINKARLLLKSVRDTNPKHGPGWIASARVEEAAGKTLQARKIIQDGCRICPDSEDVWLEAARLHPHDVAKHILATAVRHIPTSVKIFMKAADLEHTDHSKRLVFRKALEANPTSVTLWKAAIELEDAEDARVLLSVAVEKVPHSVEMWLALSRLETYNNAQRVLNKARKALPAEKSIWIAAAKLEESQNHDNIVEKVIDRAVKSLIKNDAVVSREQWLQEAELAESSGAPLTSAAIIKHTIGMNVDNEDQQRTWSEDAKGTMARGSIATARAILDHALDIFPTKRGLWMQAVDLERKHGTKITLDNVLESACIRLPRVEIFWLYRAKERWISGDVDKAREILTEAFAANPDSEEVWLAAAKLEWENGEIERARVLLERARDRASTDRVYMKSALLEREQCQYDVALILIEDGITKYRDFPKLYMMGGQICSQDLTKNKTNLERARLFYQRGLQACPNNTVLWTLASRLEEKATTYLDDGDDAHTPAGCTTASTTTSTSTTSVSVTKARSLLELARLKNPKTPELWLEAIRLERRAGNMKLSNTLMSKALQECSNSGILLAEDIRYASRNEQKSKSAYAIRKRPDDPIVIAAVADLFAMERKHDKARKWYDRSIILNSDIGDSWIRYYSFEKHILDSMMMMNSAKTPLNNNNNNNGEDDTTTTAAAAAEQQQRIKQQQQRITKIVERCIEAEPKHGEIWTSIMKDMSLSSSSSSSVCKIKQEDNNNNNNNNQQANNDNNNNDNNNSNSITTITTSKRKRITIADGLELGMLRLSSNN